MHIAAIDAACDAVIRSGGAQIGRRRGFGSGSPVARAAITSPMCSIPRWTLRRTSGPMTQRQNGISSFVRLRSIRNVAPFSSEASATRVTLSAMSGTELQRTDLPSICGSIGSANPVPIGWVAAAKTAETGASIVRVCGIGYLM
jgi:hypothetical protein